LSPFFGRPWWATPTQAAGSTLPPPASFTRSPAHERHRDGSRETQATRQLHADRDASRRQRAGTEQREPGRHDQRLTPPQPQLEAARSNSERGPTPEAARLGRFASNFAHHDHPEHWHADRIEAHEAWRRHHHAAFVAWTGRRLFWPYVYTDLLYYPFWPDAYDDAYWPDAYDDFLDSVYLGTGAPSDDPDATEPAGQAQEHGRRQAESAGAGICGSGSGLTAWPFAKIESAVRLSVEQQTLFDQLKADASQAADVLKASCPREAALTPTGRLQAMLDRLEAASKASHMVHASLMTFYNSLSDGQKSQFNAIGPDAGPKTASASVDATCAERKGGFTDLPIKRITDVVLPMETQRAKLDELKKANDLAIAILQAACPDSMPQTPVDRLEAIDGGLDAMILAAKAVQGALQEFYGSLTDEQKARMNALTQRPRGNV
jgi:hypothetical protein